MNEQTADEQPRDKLSAYLLSTLGPRNWLGLGWTLSAENQTYQAQQGSQLEFHRQERATNPT